MHCQQIGKVHFILKGNKIKLVHAALKTENKKIKGTVQQELLTTNW
jgi:hypothetical protein